MPQKDVYSKKITSEEEQKNFVLVLKDRLSFFPEQGETSGPATLSLLCQVKGSQSGG